MSSLQPILRRRESVPPRHPGRVLRVAAHATALVLLAVVGTDARELRPMRASRELLVQAVPTDAPARAGNTAPAPENVEQIPLPDEDYPHGSYRGDCALCHEAGRWSPVKTSAGFDHAATGFALEGAHHTTPCTSCHESLDFQQAPTACMDCHEDIHLGELGTACERCHDPRSFTDRAHLQKEHSTFRFPLTGAHLGLDCQSCHPGAPQGQGTYLSTPSECVACHQSDYDTTTAPDHQSAGFGTNCSTCHSTLAWASAAFSHAGTDFPLTGAHESTACESCHADGVYDGKPSECVSCHAGDYDSTVDPDHEDAGFSTNCATCHGTSTWEGAVFNHDVTDFPLTGSHKMQDCQSCHADGVYDGKATDCFACHQTDFNTADDPEHKDAGFPTDCATCHGTATWDDADFDHGATDFALTGAHQNADCKSCHADGVFDGKPTDCVSCHQTDYTGADPNHEEAGFSTNCATCHGTSTWEGAVFNHDVTDFPLTGSHKMQDCQSCHADGIYDGKPTNCFACHQTDFNTADDPEHKDAGFPTDCATCHGTATWDGATFNHGTTDFPLTGSHQSEPCNSCHGDGVYAGKSADCFSCHQADYAGADPNHQDAGFSTSCETCHGTSTWDGAVFNHDTTSFPLTGSHRTADCQSCHADGVYNGKPTSCVSCHQTDYNGSTSPNHVAAGLPTACQDCHGTTTWAGALYNHNATDFPLTGAHKLEPCESCHGDNVYQGKSEDCFACHLADYNGAASPEHKNAGFPTECDTCHGTSTWDGATFDHGATDFPLTGAHKSEPCDSCHGDGVYQGKSTECFECHGPDYNGATDPDHGDAGFPTDCTVCHSTMSWVGATFDHGATDFPLTGAHLAGACRDCHGDGVYAGKSTQCIDCHQSDYSGALDPNHVAGGFATTCQDCHGTTAWQGAGYDHNATDFPLTGSHVGAACSDCHGDGVYSGKSTACQSCHQADYDNTADPDHAAAGFPTDCADCHGTATWDGARFDHDSQYFPIYSGAHRGRWSECSDCHTNSNSFAVYDCLGCHPHSDKQKTDSDHTGEAGYSYQSTACYNCHPRGDH